MIDRAGNWTVPAGSPIGLYWGRLLPSGGRRQLLGEVYALTIYAPDRTNVASAASTIEPDMDGDLAFMVLPTGASETLIGEVGLYWELAELLPNGQRQRRDGGRFTVTNSAASVAGTAPALGSPDFETIIEEAEL